MRSLDLKIVIPFVLLLISAAPVVRAEEEPWTDKFFRQFEAIQAKLDKLEQQQKEILEKEDQLSAQLDQLRIWVHRR